MRAIRRGGITQSLSRILLPLVAAIVCGAAASLSLAGEPTTIDLVFRIPSCGDAQVDNGEQCDDGNLVASDGCSVACFLGPTIDIETSPFDLTFVPMEVGNISTTVSFHVQGAEPYTVTVIQNIVAISGPVGGITLFPAVVGGFVSSTDLATVDNQEITAVADGVYEVTTTATILETGVEASSVALVTVGPVSQNLALETPGSDPGGLAPGVMTPVVFTSQVLGADLAIPVAVSLSGDVVLALNDQGIDGDLVADDATFSGTAVVDTMGFSLGSCISVVATAIQGTDVAISPAHLICVTSLPLELAPSDMTNPVNDPVSGQPSVADEVLGVIVPGTTEIEIVQIAASVAGTVVGSVPGLDTYQIKLATPVSSSTEMAQVISDLENFPEVLAAEANVIDEGAAVTPSDTMFASQGGLTKIRADEAWTIARGAVTIAVVDSGADLDHPDLAAKIIKGKDFVDAGDPEDQHGHGTHVAGIAGAVTNNGKGIAGVSWGSKILVVRVWNSSNRGPVSQTAAGIKYAADKGARIINISGGGTGGKTIKCNAVTYAISKGSMVVAAAMNNNNSTKNYPAACTGAIAVGNTTLTDGRAATSNFGSWVDLAAPGTSVLSTVPVGGSCTHCTASGYKSLSGTSMSSPMMSGSAAVLLTRQPKLTNAEIETRFKRTAKSLPGLNLGAGRIDLFEAVFNGSFEEGNLALWTRVGTTSSKTTLGTIVPQHRKRMGSVSTGPEDAQVAGTLSQSFTIQAGVTSFPLSFKYTFVTEEYPEFVGSIFDDFLQIELVPPSGIPVILAQESVNASSFNAIGGIDFPGGDDTVGWTTWKTVSTTVTVTPGGGVYRIQLEDAGDAIYDTETLIDEIKFK